jgi:hypothetical protein
MYIYILNIHFLKESSYYDKTKHTQTQNFSLDIESIFILIDK